MNGAPWGSAISVWPFIVAAVALVALGAGLASLVWWLV